MNEPSVVALMLTRGRPELAAKAIECFRAQTYENKWLLIFDSGLRPPGGPWHIDEVYADARHLACQSIGVLRNAAVTMARSAEIIIHWDDDDLSHSNRIAEQVALLQECGADVVGYSDMLFWRSDEAWLYTVMPGCTPALGTSLCYWRKTWERAPFPDLPNPKGGSSEYGEWLKALKCVTRPSLEEEPRMIARIHSGNAHRPAYDLERLSAQTPSSWKRVPEWDERIRECLAG